MLLWSTLEYKFKRTTWLLYLYRYLLHNETLNFVLTVKNIEESLNLIYDNFSDNWYVCKDYCVISSWR